MASKCTKSLQMVRKQHRLFAPVWVDEQSLPLKAKRQSGSIIQVQNK